MGRCRQPPLRTASGRRCGSGPGRWVPAR